MQYAELTWDNNKDEHKAFLQQLAPVAIFTYNRLDHTKQTIEALQRNVYAEDTKVFVFSDGPKNEQAVGQVNYVRDYLHMVTGFKAIEIIERQENWGLAENIIAGVTDIVNRYGKIIVLEDDIVTSKWFLKYMNDALKIYEDKLNVMEISGYMYPMDTAGLPETFFLHFGDCWGWATWARSWKFFERNPKKLIQEFSEEDVYHFKLEGVADFWDQVLANQAGTLYTWAVFWQAAIVRQNGLMLASRCTLAKNIGFDGTGVHCGVGSQLEIDSFGEREIRLFPVVCVEDEEARKKLHRFFRSMNGSWIRRFLSKTKKWISQCF